MKAIKKSKRIVAIVLVCIFFIPTILSCSNEKQFIDESVNKYRESALKIINAVEIVSNFEQNNFAQKDGDYEITQEMVDQYAVMLGYQAGDFDVYLVEQVIDKYADVLDKGYEQVIDEYDLSSFTKLSLKDIAEGNWIEDLESHPNYQNLSLTEKEMLSVANAYAQELQNNGKGITPAGVGAFIGLIVGGWICNVWCVLGGAIIGAIIGESTTK
ncbi:MAG TPA: hypothetical protein PKL92_00485 [Aquaticitalea sp.]|nr:hypothetical protein [Aquaticitalea sp.]HNU59102.1 hypothetical protein [Aquaticitalea sp.]